MTFWLLVCFLSETSLLPSLVSRENELRERIPVPHDNFFLNLFKVRARAAKIILACCFRDPRGLLSRERDMFRRQTFEV